jgi:hypothetical protein
MELRRRLAQRASCIREEHKDRLVFHWPLSIVEAGKRPSVVLTWKGNGEMTCHILEHDTFTEQTK